MAPLEPSLEERAVARLAGPTAAALDEGAAARLAERLAWVLGERRRTLLRRFGWAGPALRCVVEPRRRTLALAGEALSRKALTAALAELQAALPVGWTIDAAATELAAPREWLALPAGATRLWRAPPVDAFSEVFFGACASEHVREDMVRATRERGARPGSADVRVGGDDAALAGGRDGEAGAEERGAPGARGGWCPGGHVREDSELCTELLAGDGPVGVLAAAGEWALVRARDGTIGWTRARLGAPVAAPAPTTVRGGAAALARALRRFLGAPYLLGGTTRLGIDCSGLVQRAMGAALGAVLPRHSSDQLALAAAPVRALGEPGDLLFLWGAGEAPCHVGVVLRGSRAGDRTLLHASSRRGRVIEEPLEHALRRAARWRHMELEQVQALRR